MIRLAACAAVLLWAPILADAATTASHTWPPVRVAWVGCRSDGQVGPQGPPRAKPFALVRVDPLLAPRLALYESRYGEALAPRGWHCLALEGSNGNQLFIARAPVDAPDLLQGSRIIHGPAVQIASLSGDTSGRFEVAQMVTRYFPAHHAFADAVIAEGIVPAHDFPTGAYPGDRILARTADRVEIETPPHTKGFGTSGRLPPDDLAVVSVAVFDAAAPGAVTMHVKLPTAQRDLLPAILGRF